MNQNQKDLMGIIMKKYKIKNKVSDDKNNFTQFEIDDNEKINKVNVFFKDAHYDIEFWLCETQIRDDEILGRQTICFCTKKDFITGIDESKLKNVIWERISNG
tara:strand:- start:86 stop:394 length:309 start_codon:yes stop_codon:yes gene_type:complete